MSRIGKIFVLAIGVVTLLLGDLPAEAQFSDTWEFHKALKDRDYREMLTRLSNGANINRVDGDGIPAFVTAADAGDQKLMKFLLDNGARINGAISESQETALMRRASAGDTTTVQFLLEVGADPDAADRRGETALMKAARNRKRSIVKALIEHGADPNIYDYTGKSALHYARDARASSIVRALEAAGSD